MLFFFASRRLRQKRNTKICFPRTFYENLSDWFEKQTLNGDLPKLPQGMESQKIEAISTGYALEVMSLKKQHGTKSNAN